MQRLNVDVGEYEVLLTQAMQAACGDGAFSENFALQRLELKEFYINTLSDMELATASGTVSVGSGLTLGQAAQIFNGQLLYDLQRLTSACGGADTSIGDFILGNSDTLEVTRPFGGSCAGGADDPGGSSGEQGASCLQQAINTATQECAGPVTDGDDPVQDLPQTPAEWEEATGEEWDDLSEEEKEELRQAMQQLAELREQLEDHAAEESDEAAQLGWISGPTLIIGGLLTGGVGLLLLTVGAFFSGWALGDQWESMSAQEKVDAIRDATSAFLLYQQGSGSHDCPAFGAFNGTPFTFVDPVTGYTNKIADLIRQCLCNNSSHSYSSDGVYLGPPATCSAEGSARRDCLYNPFGPDDHVRWECAGYLYEDLDIWDSAETTPEDQFCSVVQCPNGMVARHGEEQCRCESLVGDPGNAVADCAAYLCPSGNPASSVSPGERCGCGLGYGISFGADRAFEFLLEDVVRPVPGSWFDPDYGL